MTRLLASQTKKWFKTSAMACVLLLISNHAMAADLFATGWGREFNASPEGQLFFVMMQLFGIWTCIKALTLAYRYAHNKTKHGYWTSTTIFLAGTLLYFMHETLNLIYNSF